MNKWPRLFSFAFFGVLVSLGLFFMYPEQAAVAFYKITLVIVAALIGYWLDRSTFPYSRPDGYLKTFWRHGTTEPINEADFEVADGYKIVFAIAMIRRTIIMAAVVLAVSLGL